MKIDEKFAERIHSLIEIALAQGLITKYEDFCNTRTADEYALKEEEIDKYINKFENGGIKND